MRKRAKKCAACGMLTESVTEYHPDTACLLFRACGDRETVRANLQAVVEYGAEANDAEVGPLEAMVDIRWLQKVEVLPND